MSWFSQNILIYIEDEHMKIYIFAYIFIILLLLSSGCRQSEKHDKESSQNIAAEAQLIEYTYEEIYDNGKYADILSDPVSERIQLYPADNGIYAYFNNWYYIHINNADILQVHSICRDPLCNHTSQSCIAYAASGSMNAYAVNGILYIMIYGEDMAGQKLAAYDLSSSQTRILSTFDTGGHLLTRLGRFLYFSIIRYDGQTDSGKMISTQLINRYDIISGKIVKLTELPPASEIYRMTAAAGYIYYLNTQRNLIRCDVNLKNSKTLISSDRVWIYTVKGKCIYYLTQNENEHYGDLYRLNTETDEHDLLYKNITWFCYDNDILYYSIYDPIEGFEWDYPVYDEKNEYVITRVTATIFNGNKVYAVHAEEAGSKIGVEVAVLSGLPDKGYYLGETYAVCDGIFYSQLKEPYTKGNKLGVINGIAGVSLASGEVVRIAADYVMY